MWKSWWACLFLRWAKSVWSFLPVVSDGSPPPIMQHPVCSSSCCLRLTPAHPSLHSCGPVLNYDCDACGCQSSDAGKGERGQDEPGGEICSPSLLGWPVPECECQLLLFNFRDSLLLISPSSCCMKVITFFLSFFLCVAPGRFWSQRIKSVAILLQKRHTEGQSCLGVFEQILH